MATLGLIHHLIAPFPRPQASIMPNIIFRSRRGHRHLSNSRRPRYTKRTTIFHFDLDDLHDHNKHDHSDHHSHMADRLEPSKSTLQLRAKQQQSANE
jgi:hypothetical protein